MSASLHGATATFQTDPRRLQKSENRELQIVLTQNWQARLPKEDAVLLNEVDAAERLGFSPKTLRQWRWKGQGPVHLKIGRSVRYRESDIEEFIRKNERRPSDPMIQ